MNELTEERLAEIERAGNAIIEYNAAKGLTHKSKWKEIIMPLVAEVRRLTNERENLKKIAQELLQLLIEEGYSDSVLMHYRWLLEPEPATATGVAEAIIGMSGEF